MPEFDLRTMVGVGVPLFIVTMASQNAWRRGDARATAAYRFRR